MISVIVPVHNGEKTLRRCVDSILISTEKDIEVILVENGSTDRTLDICRLYSDKYNNVKTVVADVTGLSHARNVGMGAAKGEWISFIDADDYIHPSMYSWMLEAAKSKHFEFVFGDILIGKAADYVWNDKNDHECRSVSVDAYYKELFCTAQYKYSLVINKLFSAELLKNFYFDETLYYAEDREFLCRILARASAIGYVDTPVYYYYQDNAESISKSANMEVRMDQIRSLQKCLNTADTSFSAVPKYGDYVAVCLLQNADFRKKRAIECGLPAQVEELNPIIKKAAKRVKTSANLDLHTKSKFLLEHYAPGLFHIAAKLLRKG